MNAPNQSVMGGKGNAADQSVAPTAPTATPATISLPTGGGAIQGIGEKFATNPVTGTAAITIPLGLTGGRSGFNPDLALAYNSGAGNGPFGIGWQLNLASIQRKTSKGLPLYQDEDDSDTFLLSDVEDLVPVRIESNGEWVDDVRPEGDYTVRRYRPRVEGTFARIERWTSAGNDVFWKTISRENVTRYYGRASQARVSDPDDPSRVFEWLIEEAWDELGNGIRYEYKAEDRVGLDDSHPYEQTRSQAGQRCTYVYPKRVWWGNTTPFSSDGWLFEAVFDYGEHDLANPTPDESQSWLVRSDMFSTFRSCFDVRCYRRCQRVLIFHLFSELGSDPTLVRLLAFTYDESPVISYLRWATQTGYRRENGGYTSLSLPPLEFDYSRAVIEDGEEAEVVVHDVNGLDDLPAGVDPSRYQWVDLNGEGTTGLLAMHQGQWFYKRNPGEGEFSPAVVVSSEPSLGRNFSGAHLVDLAGDGKIDLVRYNGNIAGYQEHDGDVEWEPFQPFSSTPLVDWSDPTLHLVDLTGDGHADILLALDDELEWHSSLAKEGFDVASTVPRATDEDDGPTLLASNHKEAIFLSDMKGDGLADIVRIRNGSVCYWPNRGYGRYGAKVVMENAPWFDSPDLFDPSRIRLGDIDGSGTTDIVYLTHDSAKIWFNQSGNSFADVHELDRFPGMNSATDVNLVDLLGDGTACLVWFSPLPAHSGHPMRYIQLMSKKKPHLLTFLRNNLGREITFQYSTSTRFYTEDKLAGHPWITRLPFPVQVLETVTIRDYITGWKFVTTYAYHHGYFDGDEREFRGFGQVEQWDTEDFSEFEDGQATNADLELHVPPAYTRTWYHTGAYLEDESISRQFSDEYYTGDPNAVRLPDTKFPVEITAKETREACRALKGRMLRQEVYADDGSDKAVHPYSVVEQSFQVRRLQPIINDDYAVFLVVPDQTLTWHYERNSTDPRVLHALTLEADDYGNVTLAASVAYSRRPPGSSDYDEQKVTLITVAKSQFINQDDRTDAYHIGVGYETESYELTGPDLSGDDSAPFSATELLSRFQSADEISFEVEPDPTNTNAQRRLIAHDRTLFYNDDLSAALDAGQLGLHALVYEKYSLALTPGLITSAYAGRVTDDLLKEGAYVQLDDVWWLPSGRTVFDDKYFYLPKELHGPFDNVMSIEYDDYHLLVRQATNPLGSIVKAALDYHVLQPSQITDPNKNRTQVAFDPLGRVIATAVMGKEGDTDGDSLEDPTTRFTYILDAYSTNGFPNSVRVEAREEHQKTDTRWQESVQYSDGSGHIVLVKAKAEPGLAPVRDSTTGELKKNGNGDLTLEWADPRWVGSGRTIVDNKGDPVKQYEPYFFSTDEYEDEIELVEWGVTPILRYDPIGRNIQTDLPNGTLRRVEFDAWKQVTSDENDTVLESQWYATRGSPDPAGSEPTDAETRAAWLTAKHANTPAEAHLDTLGRVFLAIANNGSDGLYETTTELDIKGNPVAITDARDNTVMKYTYDLVGRTLYTKSMDAGERWMLLNVVNNPIRRWDSREQTFRTKYDQLQRSTHLFLQTGSAAELLVERTIYGEFDSTDPNSNLKGQIYQQYDQAGVLTNNNFDFKANLLSTTRCLAIEYHTAVDWTALDMLTDPADITPAAAALLETDTFTQTTAYDALNRPTSIITPDNSEVAPTYNEAGQLEQMKARLRGAVDWSTFVENIDYNEKGQRLLLDYGNGVKTEYGYDEKTFRLTKLKSIRRAGLNGLASQLFSDPAVVQDLRYTYDPAGNITRIEDAALVTIFYNNEKVEPLSDYTYDAIYRLIEATGRENIGQMASDFDPADGNRRDFPFLGLRVNPNDPQAMRRYIEQYDYDAVGNFEFMRHIANGGNWTRAYEYNEASLIEPSKKSNRLTKTTVGNGVNYVETYTYKDTQGNDVHGCMTAMNSMQMQWDIKDQFQKVDLGGGGTAYYVYDAQGQRVRKVTERYAAAGQTPTRKSERIYVNAFEVYREYAGDGITLTKATETLHIMDDKHRVALVDTISYDGSIIPNPSPIPHYQLANHLNSSCIELDAAGLVISYEEYYPYGTSAYQATSGSVELSAKRYRYTAKERDEETGLYYHGARYYACWLGRWSSCDPAGFSDGLHLYLYVRGNPICMKDERGLQSETSNKRLLPGHFTGNETPEEIHEFVQTQGYDFEGTPKWDPETKTWDVGNFTKTPPEQSDSDSSARYAGLGTVTTYNAAHRAKYEKKIKTASNEAVEEIKELRRSDKGTGALEAYTKGKEVSAGREAARDATREKLTPSGKALSKKIDETKPLEHYADKYSRPYSKPPDAATSIAKEVPIRPSGESVDLYQVAEGLAKGAGKSRGGFSGFVLRSAKVLGPVGIAVGVVLGIHEIIEAPADEKGQVAAREGGAFAGGLLGGELGALAGVEAAGGISLLLTTLGVAAGPIGWLAIGLAIGGGILGAWLLGNAFGTAGEGVYEMAQ